MTDSYGTTRARIVRQLLAVSLVLSALVAVPTSARAAPTQSDIDAAKHKLSTLNYRQSALDEQFNQAQIALQRAQSNLAAARAAARTASARAARARDLLSRRAKAAYEGSGSQIGMLLGAKSFGQFSDRLEFIGQIASDDQEVVTRAQVAGQQARWAGQALKRAVADRQAAVRALDRKRTELQGAISDQQALISKLQRELKHEQFLAALRAAQVATPPQGQGSSTQGSSTQDASSTSSAPIPPPPPPPPPNLTGAAAAIAAAKSVLGVPYRYAGASPETGFDCSGLTMWAWAHAGVSLPHSSAAQYASLPHVSRADLQPGDLVFFYSPISHVGMYLGGGQMIHAPHTGSVVQIVAVYWQYFSGAARP
jgi:cell wall-associated NlpC family hydrolase